MRARSRTRNYGADSVVRLVRLVLLCCVVAVLLAGAWLAWTGAQAASELRAASVAVDRLTLALRDGRLYDARGDLSTVRTESRAAADHVHGPVWVVAAHLPVIADDVTAVRQASMLVADAAEDVGLELLDVAGTLDPDDLLPTDGRLPLKPLEEAAPRLADLAEQLKGFGVRAEAIDLDGVRPIVADPLATLKTEVTRIRDLTAEAATAARLLPPMLGSDGDRRYLLLVQNNAELRATGGIPGAYAELRAAKGRIRLGEQGGASGLGFYEKPVLPLTAEEEDIFGEVFGLYPQNVTLTPRFPRSGELAAAMWADSHPTEVDGVASVDPVALSYLLRATGPVTVQRPDGKTVDLTTDNVVPYLLNQVYLENPDDPEAQDEIFAAAAGAVFDAVTAGGADPRTLLAALTQAVEERRLLLWATREAEQSQIARAPIAGDLDGSQDGEPYVGVFFNNQSGSKLDYYLASEVATESIRCTADGDAPPRQLLSVAVTLRSDVPENPKKLGRYVLGLSQPKGYSVTNLAVYLPRGAELQSATTDRVAADGTTSSNPTAYNQKPDAGYPVQRLSLGLEPGEAATVTFRFLAPPGLDGPVDLQVTPQVRPVPVEIGPSTC